MNGNPVIAAGLFFLYPRHMSCLAYKKTPESGALSGSNP